MFSLLLGAAFSFTCSPATGMTSPTDTSAKAWPCCCIQRMVDLTSTYPCPVVKFSETIQICLINQTEQFWEQFPNRHQNEKKKFFVKIFSGCLLPYVFLSLWRRQQLQCSLWGNLFVAFLARSAVLSHPLIIAKKDNLQMTTWKKRQLSLLRKTQRQWRLKGKEIRKWSNLRMSQDRPLDPLWVVLAHESLPWCNWIWQNRWHSWLHPTVFG